MIEMKNKKLKSIAPKELAENVFLLVTFLSFDTTLFVTFFISQMERSATLMMALFAVVGLALLVYAAWRLLHSIQTVELTPEAIVIRSPLKELARISPASLVRVRAMNITINAGRHTHVYRKIVVFCSTDAEEIRYHKNRRRGAGYWFITPTEENKQALLAYLRAHAPEVPFGISLM